MAAVLDQASDTVYVLRLEGPLRVPMTDDLPRRVQALLAAGERYLVLDMSGVSSIDAAGIGELIRAYNLAASAYGRLRIVQPTRWVRETLQRVGVFKLLVDAP